MVFNRAHLETSGARICDVGDLAERGRTGRRRALCKISNSSQRRCARSRRRNASFVHEEKRCRFRPESLLIAVKRSNGTIEIVRYYAEHVPVEMCLEHEKLVKRATMFACQLGYFEVLKCLVETLRLRAPNVCPWSPWCLSMARRENHQACLNFCLENGCPEYHPNECHSRYIVGEPIRNGLPYYRKCARAARRRHVVLLQNTSILLRVRRVHASWKPLKLLSGRFRKKNRASRVECRGVVLPLKTTTTNPTIPTHKKTGENRQTKKRVGAHKKKKTKKERKEKGKRKKRKEKEKGKGKKKCKESSII